MLTIDLGDLDDGNIEGTATQIVDRDLGITALFVHTVSQGSRGRLIDDTLDFEAGDTARVLGGLALGVVEISRYRDHGVGDRLAQVILGRFLHLHQNTGGYFRRRHFLALSLDPGVPIIGLGNRVGHQGDVLLHLRLLETPADQPLYREQRVAGVGHGLALGRLPHQYLVILGKGDDRRGRAIAFAVFNDPRFTTFHHRYTGVGGS